MTIRIDAEADRHIRVAGIHEGVSISAFVASAAKAAADRTVADGAEFPLDRAAWDRFGEMLDRPQRNLPGLESADAAWRSLFGSPHDATQTVRGQLSGFP